MQKALQKKPLHWFSTVKNTISNNGLIFLELMTWILWKLPCKATTTNLFSNPGQDSSIGDLVTHSLTHLSLTHIFYFSIFRALQSWDNDKCKEKGIASEWVITWLAILAMLMSICAHTGGNHEWHYSILKNWFQWKNVIFQLASFWFAILPLATGQWGGNPARISFGHSPLFWSPTRSYW